MKFLRLCLLCFVSVTTYGQSADIPSLSSPGQGAYLKGGLIYPLDHKPTPQCHASTIVETSSGLLSAFFSGTEEGNNDVGIRVVHLIDGQWSWPVEIVNGYV